MTIKARGLLRLLFMCLLIIGTGTAGFLWAQHSEPAYLAAAAATLTALVAGFAVENIATSAETQLALVMSLLKTATAHDLLSDEKVKRLDLIVAMLEEQNEKFRMGILSGKVHEMDAIRRSDLEKVTVPSNGQIS